ncbi:hypothetical protein [Paenirhodobacter sp.]|uniref:hypothetical protein n=1 Tax=Paenirhodobacter sp. TaxID=1965326 RepID=UPI003B417B20
MLVQFCDLLVDLCRGRHQYRPTLRGHFAPRTDTGAPVIAIVQADRPGIARGDGRTGFVHRLTGITV